MKCLKWLKFNEAELGNIIDNAVDIYMEGRRKTKQDKPAPEKKEQEEATEDRFEEDIVFYIKDVYFESSDEE